MTKHNENLKGKKLVMQILCLVFAMITFVALFLPVFKHQRPDKPQVGLGDFYIGGIVEGGLYDKDSDKIDEETGYFSKYSKLSEDAQYYYQTFVLMDEGSTGKIFALCVLFAEICGAILILAVLLSWLAEIDTFLPQLIFGVLQMAFVVVLMLCVPSLSNIVANTEFVTLNFEVVLRPAVWVLLLASAGYIAFTLLGKFLTTKKQK